MNPKIQDPISGKWLKVTSNKGKKVLKRYLKQVGGAGSSGAPSEQWALERTLSVGHTRAVAVFADFVVSASFDRTVKIWNAAECRSRCGAIGYDNYCHNPNGRDICHCYENEGQCGCGSSSFNGLPSGCHPGAVDFTESDKKLNTLLPVNESQIVSMAAAPEATGTTSLVAAAALMGVVVGVSFATVVIKRRAAAETPAREALISDD